MGALLSLKDLAGLSQPLTKLIETAGKGIGTLYEPTGIRRKAKAEADALVTQAEGEAAANEIAVRANERLINREIRRQENVERITQNAVKELPQSVSDEPVDEDWIHRFYDSCQDIGDEEMQSLWGRILAGEVTQPKSFSFRTLRVVRDLRKEDAESFAAVCQFAWKIQGFGQVPVVPKFEDEVVATAGVTLRSAMHLQSLDLIDTSEVGISILSVDSVDTYYFGQLHKFHKDTQDRFRLGKVLFTSAGEELLKVATVSGNESFRLAAIEHWAEDGWTLEH